MNKPVQVKDMEIGKRYKRVEINTLMGDKYRTLIDMNTSDDPWGNTGRITLVFQEPGKNPITVIDDFTELYEKEGSRGGKYKSRHKSRRNQRSKKSRKNHRTTNRRR